MAWSRERLGEGRAWLRHQHDEGLSGVQISRCQTNLLDEVILHLYQAAVRELAAELGTSGGDLALVPHGGYGRCDVAPFSDVDLMLLHAPHAVARASLLARRLVEDLSDTGLDLGFSLRTPSQACLLAVKDPVILTALCEARYLAGSQPLFAGFISRFGRTLRARRRSLIEAIDQARGEERLKYGGTVYLLEPNIKRCRGGLRDIHLLRWVGFVSQGDPEPEGLVRQGLLGESEARQMRVSQEFLLRLRNELHFRAGSGHDVLDRAEQLRIASKYGYEGRPGVLPVEQFMQDYFHHTGEVRNISDHFVATARHRWGGRSRVLAPLVSHQVEGDFRVGPHHISATRRGMRKVDGDLTEVLRLMDLANLYDKPMDHRTWQTIRTAMRARDEVSLTPAAVQRFLSLLSQPARLGDLLRRLHELRVLEKIIPGFQHARCLLQFNDYHKYTVDEHCIRSVETATEFLNLPGPLGEAYRGLKQKRTLHLALLIHDLGKGLPEDHSEVGRRMATDVASRLSLPADEAETLRFLVHRHLMLSHLAFRRDTGDEAIVLRAAVEIGSPANLRMLYILTCADLAAVGPGVLNQWKTEVLTDLYRRMMEHLSGGSASSSLDSRRAVLLRQVHAAVPHGATADWFHRQIEALPTSSLERAEPVDVVAELARLRNLPQHTAEARGRYLAAREVCEYTIAAHERLAPGIFHRLTGALTGQGLQILSAEILTLEDGLVLDRFYVVDPDYIGSPPPERFQRAEQRLQRALTEPSDVPPAFRSVWHGQRGGIPAALNILPTKVRIDNTTSDRFTILDVFAHDRTGLLYAISRSIYEEGLSVGAAKIGTYLDQVVDVFYVTDHAGQKVRDVQRLESLERRLSQAIERLSQEP